MLSLLFLCSAVADALKFDGGISLRSCRRLHYSLTSTSCPAASRRCRTHHASDERRCETRYLCMRAAVAAGKERAGFYKGRGAPLAELDVELAGDAIPRPLG